MQATSERLLALLRRLEWCDGLSERDGPRCPDCGRPEARGHAPRCELAGVLREIVDREEDEG